MPPLPNANYSLGPAQCLDKCSTATGWHPRTVAAVLLLGTQQAPSLTHGLSLPGQYVGWKYSHRVSISSRMRPIKQNQKQNPKTNSKRKVTKKNKKSEALSPPSHKHLFWSLCLLFLIWQVLQMLSPHPASLQWLMCYGLPESLKSSPFGPPHLIKKWSLAINNSPGWVFV